MAMMAAERNTMKRGIIKEGQILHAEVEVYGRRIAFVLSLTRNQVWLPTLALRRGLLRGRGGRSAGRWASWLRSTVWVRRRENRRLGVDERP